MASFDSGASPDFVTIPTGRAGVFMNFAGAAVSLALVAGIGVWGYQLIMRDVSGIPVVRAMEGAMRVAPQNPGGDVALHEGLAVNAVAAQGEAAGFEDVLALAPRTADLAEEDLIAEPLAESGEVLATDAPDVAIEVEVPAALDVGEIAPTGPLSADDILALADQIAGASTPLGSLAEGETVAAQTLVDGQVVANAPEVAPSVPGVAVSLRPALRPARAVAVAPTPAAAAIPAAPAVDTTAIADAVVSTTQVALTSAASIPVGTNLVQLGAFPSAEDASAAWTALNGRFAEYLVGKDRVIQEATSGGRQFFRLRAIGFDDIADARRFCATLVAGNADCIQVVVR